MQKSQRAEKRLEELYKELENLESAMILENDTAARVRLEETASVVKDAIVEVVRNLI